MKDRLKKTFLGKEFENPLVLPAGLMDVSYGSMLFAVNGGAGAVTMKSLTLAPRDGNKTPVYHDTGSGIINSMGLCNPGISEGLSEIDEFKKHASNPVIASIFATNSEDFCELTKKVNECSGADFLELNLSCPNVSAEFGIPIAASKEMVGEIVGKVKEVSSLPVLAKLSPNTYNVAEIALHAEKSGADAIVLINTVGPGMVIDIHAKRPVISARYGGLSGPAVKPVAIKLVYELTGAVKIPVIGMGGITTGEDAIEMLMAGASLVGVGSAIYYRGINVFNEINNEILSFMDSEGIEHIDDITRID